MFQTLLGKSKKPTYRTASAETARTMMEDPKQPARLVDVRTEEEYLETHIPGSLLLPVHELETRARSELPDLEAPIIVHCLSGGRSSRAARWLADNGYTNVYDLGSIYNWPWERVSGR